MYFKKPKFWDQKKISKFLIFLFPLTFPVIVNNYLNKIIPKKKNSKIKSICIGNIYIGGTGKTPIVLMLYKILDRLGYKISVGKKFYKSQKDEQKILRDKCNLVCENSREKILEICQKNKKQVVIFDDGLQDAKMDYDLKFVCFDGTTGIGNGMLIPLGPLREKIESLTKFDGVILKNITGTSLKSFEKKIKLINPKIKIFYSSYIPLNLKKFDLKKKYLVFSGIGNPNNFKNLLTKYNFKIEKEIIYPDHYDYKSKDVRTILRTAKKLNAKIITTEKDYMKIKKFDKKNIDFLEINSVIKNEKNFINFILKKIK
jgi:tetraacyldisaccharide 4'-kinase